VCAHPSGGDLRHANRDAPLRHAPCVERHAGSEDVDTDAIVSAPVVLHLPRIGLEAAQLSVPSAFKTSG
jgi:hypothetical protein